MPKKRDQSVEDNLTSSKLSKLAPPPTVDPNQRYSVPESNAILRQSHSKTYADIKAGLLRVIKDGDRTYIPGTELIRRSSLPSA